MATAKKPALEKFTTPKGVAKYPRLNVPDTKFNPLGAYSVKLVFTAEDAAPLLAKLKAAAAKAFTDAQADLKKRLAEATKGEEKGKLKKELAELKPSDLPTKPVFDDDGEETGDVEINFKMSASRKDRKTEKLITMKPRFFDAGGVDEDGKVIEPKLIPEDQVPSIWGGSVLRVSGQLNPFYTAKAGAGVSLRLSGVQIIELVSGGGGNTADAHGFGAEEGGFAAGDAPAAEAAKPAAAAGGTDDSGDEAEF